MRKTAVVLSILGPLFVAGLGSIPASAEINLLDKGGFLLGATLQGGVAFVTTRDTNFGAGIDGDEKVTWGEGYLKPGLLASYDLGGAGSLYGGWAMVGLATRGGPDAGTFNADNPTRVMQDQLYGGWRSGDLFPFLGKDAVDVSFGQQEFKIGDGFLIWDGDSGAWDEGGCWIGPKNAFKRAGLLRLNTAPVRGDFFYLQSDSDSWDTQAVGANVEYSQEKSFTVGGLALHVTQSRLDERKGMNVVSLRGNVTPIENLMISGELALERNPESNSNLNATGWYGEAGYTFSALPWSPSLTYRYSSFSGDDPNTKAVEAFDPLFYGSGRGWGTWFQGEITGEYLLLNSNETAHLVALRVQPLEALSLGLMFFRFRLNESNYYGRDLGGDKDFADELNFYADWCPTKSLYFGAVLAAARPREAGKAALGDDKTYKLFEVLAAVSF